MLRANDIHKSFDTLEVLKGIDLQIEAAEIVAIVGPSGAGKTTLLQIIGSLDRPDRGSVIYDTPEGPVDIAKLKDRELARFRNCNIGFVFQFHQLLPEFSLVENVAMPALIAGEARDEAFAKARKLIDYLGLGERLEHKPAQLSGGERQRAAVARALINNPRVILADEPSGSLDSANRRELHKLFFDIRRDLGSTFVIVTHDNELAEMADRVISLRDGRIEV
ncbi:MAG: ABC transporter ATP-binding protein [Muribaculaceae bacterium]|nr:ABC transporter ATP-binding protein [Muribaculaceae bacterium]